MMEFSLLQEILKDLLPAELIILVVVFLLWLQNKRVKSVHGMRYRSQLLGLLFIVVGLVAVILSLPISSDVKQNLLTLLGLLLTAVITLSSTTVAGNAMAGVMLRVQGSFRPGDFIQVGEHIGRVTEQDLFHTEIQTEDRDLMSLPNLYLVSQPIKVVHTSGTVVSATVSLGYDLEHHRIEQLLMQAAEQAGLKESFVHVTELADYSVHYRVAGFLLEVKQLLSARSKLRRSMLDVLHANDVEIVSPSIMNQRRIDGERLIAPVATTLEPDNSTEHLVFDKAERAQQVTELKDTYAELETELAGLTAEDAERKLKLQSRLKAIKRIIGYYLAKD